MNTFHLPFYFANVFIHAYVYIFLILMSFHSKLRHSLGKTNWIILFWVLFTAVCDIFFFEIEPLLPDFSLPMLFVWITVTIAFMYTVIKSNFLQLLFVLMVLFTFQNNTIKVAHLIYASKSISPIFPQFEVFNYLLFSVLVLVCAFPFLWYLFANLFKRIVDTNIDFLQWKYLFALPLLHYLYCRISAFGGINLTNPRINDFIVLLLLNSLAYVSYVSVLKMLLSSYDNYKISEQISVMTNQLLMQKEQYEKLTAHIEKTAKLQHDWRHHLLLIKKYTENRDLEGLEQYLGDYFTTNSTEEKAPICANHPIDIILRHYIAISKAEDTTVNVSVDIPERLPISDHHLCIVFGNLVENAVEGCIRQTNGKRFIDIKARPVGDQLAIIIQNSYSGQIIKNQEDFLSTKHEGRGIGISSVRNIAQSNGGTLNISYNNNVFKASVLIS